MVSENHTHPSSPHKTRTDLMLFLSEQVRTCLDAKDRETVMKGMQVMSGQVAGSSGPKPFIFIFLHIRFTV